MRSGGEESWGYGTANAVAERRGIVVDGSGVDALRKLLVAAEGGNLQIVKLAAATALCTRQRRAGKP